MASGPFYGWAIVGVTFLAQFTTIGTVFYSYGILLKPLAADLDVPRTAIGLGLSAQMIVVSMLGPLIGYLVDRYSIRNLMLLGAVLLAAGFVGLSRAESLLGLYLAFGGLVSSGFALLGGIANTALVANWFIRRRGTALGISQLGVSLSGMVMAFLTTFLIGEFGWRNTARVFALMPIVLVAPAVWFWVVNRPEDRGLLPDGHRVAGERVPEPEAGDGDWTLLGLLGEPRVWLLAAVIGLCFMGVGAMVQVIYSHVTDLGFEERIAARVLALTALMAALGKPGFGVLSDWASKRLAMWTCIAFQVSGLLLLLRAGSALELGLAAVVFGIGYGGVMPLWAVLIGSLFGREVFGRVMGLMGPVMLPFNALGLPFATFIFDRTGSYTPAFLSFLGCYLGAAVLLCFLRLPAEPLRPRKLVAPRAQSSAMKRRGLS